VSGTWVYALPEKTTSAIRSFGRRRSRSLRALFAASTRLAGGMSSASIDDERSSATAMSSPSAVSARCWGELGSCGRASATADAAIAVSNSAEGTQLSLARQVRGSLARWAAPGNRMAADWRRRATSRAASSGTSPSSAR
jgi:hypothetical protein